MPYHKDKQQAFQAAQQGYEEAMKVESTIVETEDDYGVKQHQLKQEIGEALQQIENALEVASEHQRNQLRRFQEDLYRLNQQYDDV